MLIQIAADHLMVRQALVRLLTETLPSAKTLEGPTGPECVALASRAGPDVVILDFSLPDVPLDTLSQISALRPRVPVVVLSSFPEREMGIEAVRRGASGFVSKNSSSQELATAAVRCANGERYISDDLALQLALSAQRGLGQDPHARLSHREREVFRGIVAGTPLTEIAQSLGVSVKTIGTYRARILSKLNVATNADLVRYAASKHLALKLMALLSFLNLDLHRLVAAGY